MEGVRAYVEGLQEVVDVCADGLHDWLGDRLGVNLDKLGDLCRVGLVLRELLEFA